MTDEERKKLIEQYSMGFDVVSESLDGFPKDKLGARPFAGKWSACEIIQHLADSEMISAIRLRRLLAEDNPVIQAYDQEEFARKLRYHERDHESALWALRAARATTVDLLHSMSASDWTRAGTHPEHGKYTPENWLRIYAAHAHNHANQIQRLKETLI